MMLGTGADSIVQFVIFAILARVLPLRDLGLVAFILVFVDFSRILVSGGLSATIVQRPDWDDYTASVCFTYNTVMAVSVGTLFAVIGAPLFEHFYGSGSGLIVAALGLVFIIDAFRAVHVAKLRRDLQYRSLAVRGSVAGVVAGAIAIIMAFSGAGAWSLVVQRLVYQFVLTWLTLRVTRWWPGFTFDRAVLRNLMPFGSRVAITRGIETLNVRIPDLIVGLIAGPGGVALYRVGTRALDAVRRIVLLPFQDASFSALSRQPTVPAIGDAYLRLNRAVATAIFPMFFGLTAVAAEVAILLFGSKYEASGGILAVLSLAGVPNTLMLFAGSAFLASGQPQIGNLTNGLLFACNVALILPFTYQFGIIGAAIGNLAAMVVVCPIVMILLKRRLGVRGTDVVRAIGAPAALSAAMAAILWAIKLWALPPMSNFAVVLTLVVVGGLLYLAMFALWGRNHLNELVTDLAPLFPARVSGWLAALGGRT